ncbi:MAG: hypothetical protein Q7S33_04825 [Nanoarchaeota archaeon]|nr:hypothetical protein [Nanoarchaeota archaeon]
MYQIYGKYYNVGKIKKRLYLFSLITFICSLFVFFSDNLSLTILEIFMLLSVIFACVVLFYSVELLIRHERQKDIWIGILFSLIPLAVFCFVVRMII